MDVTPSGCLTVWCPRCSQFFPIHLLYPRHGPGPRDHTQDCIGCNRPPVLFKKEMVEVKPYDIPISKLFPEDEV